MNITERLNRIDATQPGHEFYISLHTPLADAQDFSGPPKDPTVRDAVWEFCYHVNAALAAIGAFFRAVALWSWRS